MSRFFLEGFPELAPSVWLFRHHFVSFGNLQTRNDLTSKSTATRANTIAIHCIFCTRVGQSGAVPVHGTIQRRVEKTWKIDRRKRSYD